MHPRQARLLLVLTTVLLGLTAALVLSDGSDGSDPQATAAVWSVEADEVERLTVDRSEGRLVLQRAADGWRVVEPYEADADPRKVEELLDELEAIRRGVPVTTAGENEEYGLGADPVATVTVILEGGSTQTLVVGDPAPVDHRTYVRGADGSVVAVVGRPGDLLTEPAAWFRDHRVLRFQPEAVRRITLRGPEGSLSVHGARTSWWLEGFTRADPDAVDDLIVGLLDLRFDTFDDSGPPPDPPHRSVVLEFEGGERLQLSTGEAVGIGTPVWTSDGRYGRALPAALALLGQGPTDLGDSRAFPIVPHRSDRIVVTRGDRRWEAVREGREWKSDGAAARSLVDGLAAATIHYRREPVPELTETWARVEIHEAGEIRTVEVGQVIEQSWRVARDTAGGEPYLVPLEDLTVFDTLP